MSDDQPHRPADDTEEIYFQGSPMLRGYAGRFCVYALVAAALAAAPFVVGAMEGPTSPLLWILCLLGCVIACVIPVLHVRSIRYRISNYRIDYERGLLSRSIDTLQLWHVEDLRFHQSLLDRILAVGTITVVSHDDSTPELALHGLPSPRPLFESLKQRIIAVKRQRGVLKMDTGS